MKKIIIFLILAVQLFSDILISDLNKDNNILSKSLYYVDVTSNQTIISVKQDDKLFIKYDGTHINRGFTNSVYWFKFSIKNDYNYQLQRTLNITNSAINTVELYYDKNIQKKGIQKKLGNIVSPYYDFIFDGNETKNIYLKISSVTTPINTNIIFDKKDNIYKKEMMHQIVLVIFFSSILTFILYNLAIYIFSKDKAYIFYILYFLLLLIYYMYYTNMSRYFIDFDVNFIGVYLLSAMIISLIFFTRIFLNTKVFKKIEYVFNFIIVLLLGLCVVSSKDFYPIDIFIGIFLLSLLFILFVAYYCLFKKVKQAKYFVVGWSIAVVGYIYFAFMNYGIISEKFIIPYFYETTIFLEALIFSTALVNKLNTTKMLEKQISKNEILIKEIHHRVKNNMQFIISLYRLKLNQNMDDKLSENLNSIENIIQGMGKTHELLYQNTNLEFINANEYFMLLISELKRSYNLDDIVITLDTDVSLEME